MPHFLSNRLEGLNLFSVRVWDLAALAFPRSPLCDVPDFDIAFFPLPFTSFKDSGLRGPLWRSVVLTAADQLFFEKLPP